LTALPYRPSMSVEEYLQFDRSSTDARYEYSDGHVTMVASSTLDHSKICFNVVRALYEILRDSDCRVFSSDARVCLSKTHYVYPDVTVSCDGRDGGQIDIIQYPRLVVEVLSADTEGYDRGRKFAHYQQCSSIQEYMLVNTEEQAVEVYRREKDGHWIYQLFRPNSYIELLNLGVSIPIAAIYQHAIFDGDNKDKFERP